ncbi:MAG: MFS family permease [Candidatus Azotimanducaceae bacterium]|jgi:MFS family permease
MTEATRPTGRVFYGWIIVLVGSVLTFLGTGFYSYSRGVFLPSLAEELAGGSRFEIAMGFSIASITSAFAAPFIGSVLDKYSPKKVILTGIVLVTASYLLLSVCQNLIQFYLVVGLGMGLGMTCMGNLAWHRTVISWFDHWRGRAISLGVLGASLAGVVMPPLVTSLVEAIGWRSSFVVFAIIVPSILIPLVIYFLKNRPEDIGEVRDGHVYSAANKKDVKEDPAELRIWHWKEMVRFPAFWSIGLMFGAMGCVYSAVMLHLFGHLKDIGLQGAEAAVILSATALFAALGKPVVGWMSDLFGARITIWMALMFQATSLVLLAFADDFYTSLLAGVVYGFGLSGMSPLRTFSLSVAVGNASFGKANGILRLVELPLVISASPLAGFIYDSTGSYQLAFLLLAGLMVVACIGPFIIKAGGARERSQTPHN